MSISLVSFQPDQNTDTFLQSIHSQSSVQRIFSFQFCGSDVMAGDDNSTSTPSTHGTMVISQNLFIVRFTFKNMASLSNHSVLQTLGEVNSAFYSGTLQYSPVYLQQYFEIVLTSLSVSNTQIAVQCKQVWSSFCIYTSLILITFVCCFSCIECIFILLLSFFFS